jgi:hypothetical protein
LIGTLRAQVLRQEDLGQPARQSAPVDLADLLIVRGLRRTALGPKMASAKPISNSSFGHAAMAPGLLEGGQSAWAWAGLH